MSLTTIITVSVCTFLFPFLSRIFCMLSFICGLITKQSRAYWSSSLLISCCNICHTPHSCTHALSLTYSPPPTHSLTPPTLTGDKSTEIPYMHILNNVLPDDIRVLAWAPVGPDFSARFSCLQRTYKYFFPRGNMNVDVSL